MMPQNEEDFRTEQFCTWVPCPNYPREREREREREKEKNRKAPSIESTKNENEKVRMHEQCMSM